VDRKSFLKKAGIALAAAPLGARLGKTQIEKGETLIEKKEMEAGHEVINNSSNVEMSATYTFYPEPGSWRRDSLSF